MKKIVDMIVRFDQSGNIVPLKIIWSDGRTFSIDKILDIRPAASLKLGGHGMRYTCRVMDRIIYLFCDNGVWFLDAKEN